MQKTIIPLSRPHITKSDISRVTRILNTGMLIQGPEVKNLEDKLMQFFQGGYCSAVSSGTAALHLALIALDIKKGDEVIVPAFSFIATANAVELTGASCKFVDIYPEFYNIDVNLIENAISKNTRALMPVHEFGLCSDMTEIERIAGKYKLKVIEDAACALGAKCRDRLAGTYGDFGAFSLHPRKAVTSGEGGFLITSDKSLDFKIKTLRNHGIEPDSRPMNIIQAGYNYRMTDFQAALIESQLKRLEKILKRRIIIAEIYLNEIKHTGINLPKVPDDFLHSWQTFHVLVENEKMRDCLMEYLKRKGIFTNYGAQCIPYTKYYKEKYEHDSAKEFPNAFKAFKCGLAIPMYDQLSKKQAQYISKTINNFS